MHVIIALEGFGETALNEEASQITLDMLARTIPVGNNVTMLLEPRNYIHQHPTFPFSPHS